MLDMGFAEDLEAILAATPTTRQTVLFSATMPSRINGIARRHLRDPVRIEIEREVEASGEAPRVRQTAYVVARAHKAAALGRILDVEAPTAALVFCRTREEVDQLTETLNGRGYRAEALHGGMSQDQRDQVMGRLRSGTADLLVATDVAARGLDIDQLVARRQLRRAVGARVVRAPDRPDRAGRPRGRRDHAGRAARAPHAQDDRAGHQAADPGREGADLGRPPGPPAGAHPGRAARAAARGRPRAVPRRRRDADRRLRRHAGRAGRGPARARGDRRDARRAGDPGGGAAARAARGPRRRRGSGSAVAPPVRARRAASRGERRARPAAGRAGRAVGSGPGGGAKLYIAAGRSAGIRPQDLVGAIANESRLSGRDVGAIEITDRFSLVEVPDDAVDEVIAALQQTQSRAAGSRSAATAARAAIRRAATAA